jgi:type IV pilus assembly protein PilO
MAKAPTQNFDVTNMLDQAVGQFRGINPSEPGQWPTLPKMAAFLGVVAAVVLIGWFALLSSSHEALDGVREQEPKLKEDYRSRLAQAVNLSELRKQKLQVQEFVTQLEKQLPGKAEIDSLLSDINQAGLGRGLQFELFRPGQFQVKDYYAELPITIRVTGRFHDVGAFAADVANLSRIVTLQNLSITPQTPLSKEPSSALTMEATARTYRYLDAAEVAEQRRVEAAAKKASAPAK